MGLENSGADNSKNERPSRFRNAMNAAAIGVGLGLGAAGGAADAVAAEPLKTEAATSNYSEAMQYLKQPLLERFGHIENILNATEKAVAENKGGREVYDSLLKLSREIFGISFEVDEYCRDQRISQEKRPQDVSSVSDLSGFGLNEFENLIDDLHEDLVTKGGWENKAYQFEDSKKQEIAGILQQVRKVMGEKRDILNKVP